MGFTASCVATNTNSCIDYHQGFDSTTVDAICSGTSGTSSSSPCDQAGAIGKCEWATIPGSNCTTTWWFAPMNLDIARTTCVGRWTPL